MIRALIVDVMGTKASVMLDDKEIIDVNLPNSTCEIGDYIPVHADMLDESGVSALDTHSNYADDDRPTFDW